jgi:hypothetical protein
MKLSSQQRLAQEFNIPPSRADIKVQGMLSSIQNVQDGLFQMGLTAQDLEPIDWRKATISDTRNQQNCGDCWAMSSTSALTDRFMIQKGIPKLRLEPAVVAQCVPDMIDQGCGGGQPFLAGKFFEATGLPEISNACPEWRKLCVPDGCVLPSCKDIENSCMSNAVIYKAKQNSTQNLPVIKSDGSIDVPMTIINMKKELVNGPFVAAFFVPKDFMASGAGYKWDKTNGIFINGAYNDVLDNVIPAGMKSALGNPAGSAWGDILMENGSPAGHAVEVVGWDSGDAGSYGKVSYWIVRNSWGPDWCENGFFRIAMNDGSGHNKYLAFDIPTNTLVQASTGQSSALGGYFGGCVKFDPDLSTGGRGTNPPQIPPKAGGMSKKSKIVMFAVLFAVLAILVFLFFRKK